jgi:hypothetical protein
VAACWNFVVTDVSSPTDLSEGDIRDEDSSRVEDSSSAGETGLGDAGPVANDVSSGGDTSGADATAEPTCPPDATRTGDRCAVDCDVLVVGEGLGGTAAALAAAEDGVKTCLVKLWPWLGGQATTQGVSALDESIPEDGTPHWSASYKAFRDGVRSHYLGVHEVLTPFNDGDGADGAGFDPGGCWVSRLCFEPAVGASVLESMLAPHIASGALRIFEGLRVTAVSRDGARVTGVELSPSDTRFLPVQVRATQTLDATELGDLFPLAGIAYRSGAEASSVTGEPHARATAVAECVQPFTYTFVLERRPRNENHAIARPEGYAPSRYSLSTGRTYKVFDDPTGQAVWWTYRRLIAASAFDEPLTYPNDLAMVNWGPDGNDFDAGCVGGTPSGCNIIGRSAGDAAGVLSAARQYTLGYLYWLQHDAPRDDGTCCGYPNLALRKDIFGTDDGLSPYPYIRESRRLEALTTIREQDIRDDGSSARAKLFSDAVGTGAYPMDLHPCAAGEPTLTMATWTSRTRPYQVPLSAMVPATVDGLLAAAKNIGTTHLTNGAYRLHPIEWQIGEAAGMAAASAIKQGIEVRSMLSDEGRLRRFQHRLLRHRRLPIFWWSDLHPTDGPIWEAAQMAGVRGVMIGFPDDLRMRGGDPMARRYSAVLVARLFDIAPVTACRASFSDVPCDHPEYGFIQALAEAGITSGCGDGRFCADELTSRAQLATLIVRAARWPLVPPASPTFSDLPPSDPLFPFVETGHAHGLFRDDVALSTFEPKAPVSRASAAMMTYNVLRERFGLD